MTKNAKLLIVGVLALLALAAAAYLLPVGKAMLALVGWTRGAGAGGMAVRSPWAQALYWCCHAGWMMGLRSA